MIEKPLDRLNYYNGQRLEASDLKLEQEYHIRTRRWLNKSLYKPGIASGLDIRAEKDSRIVVVSPGLALDAEGREMLLLEEERIFVPGKPHKTAAGSDAEVEGLYLTIRYNEKSIEEERNGCIPKSTNGRKNGDHPAWGGPALIRAKPLFNWRDALPYGSSGEIVLGQVELTADCTKVYQINTGVRRYVGAASDAKVRQYALEGCREINFDNKGRVFFHVRGRQPKAVALYLRAEPFPTYFYTELGQHNHGLTIDLEDHELPQHQHRLESVTTKSDGSHGHKLVANTDSYFYAPTDRSGGDKLSGGIPPTQFRVDALKLGHRLGDDRAAANQTEKNQWNDHTAVILADPVGPPRVNIGLDISEGAHTHGFELAAKTGDYKEPVNLMSHAVKKSTTSSPVGANIVARSGDPLKFFVELNIAIGNTAAGDPKDQTQNILSQIQDNSGARWSGYSFKGIDANHPLVTYGTGEIKLDFLPQVDFQEGEYVIEFMAPKITIINPDGSTSEKPNGGRIFYNLYVE
jgi:hypothetical protein